MGGGMDSLYYMDHHVPRASYDQPKPNFKHISKFFRYSKEAFHTILLVFDCDLNISTTSHFSHALGRRSLLEAG
jgi:hypothetical protein